MTAGFMFETLEVGRRIDKSEFDTLKLELRQQLVQAQVALGQSDYPVIIVIAGLDGAGKGSLVHRINEWMDPRGIETNTYWEYSDEEESRPYFWRFWRRLPARGEIGVFLGSWYTQPAQARMDALLVAPHTPGYVSFRFQTTALPGRAFTLRTVTILSFSFI